MEVAPAPAIEATSDFDEDQNENQKKPHGIGLDKVGLMSDPGSSRFGASLAPPYSEETGTAMTAEGRDAQPRWWAGQKRMPVEVGKPNWDPSHDGSYCGACLERSRQTLAARVIPRSFCAARVTSALVSQCFSESLLIKASSQAHLLPTPTIFVNGLQLRCPPRTDDARLHPEIFRIAVLGLSTP